jgi:hypothetical protein
VSAKWVVSSSSDPYALAIVDGIGFGGVPHYSRRTPGSRTFTGVGREVVLVTECLRAVWAVVLQRTPSRRGSGASRGRQGMPDPDSRFIWRNMMFCNRGAGLSSSLIASATIETYKAWIARYGALPQLRLRTEVKPARVKSSNPGYCYACAGWKKGETRRGVLFYYAPQMIQ